MLEKLYDLNLIDYKELILKYYDKLNISGNEVLVLQIFLNLYQKNKDLTEREVILNSCFAEDVTSDILAKLYQLNLIEIYLKSNMKEGFKVTYLFKKLEDIINEDDLEIEANFNTVYQKLEECLGRVLIPNEIIRIEEWIKEGIEPSNIEEAILKLSKKGSQISIKSLERELFKKKSTSVKSEDESAALKFYEMMDKK